MLLCTKGTKGTLSGQTAVWCPRVSLYSIVLQLYTCMMMIGQACVSVLPEASGLHVLVNACDLSLFEEQRTNGNREDGLNELNLSQSYLSLYAL